MKRNYVFRTRLERQIVSYRSNYLSNYKKLSNNNYKVMSMIFENVPKNFKHKP